MIYALIYSSASYTIGAKLRRRVEMMGKSATTKNGHERVAINRDNVKHLEFFMNGQWRHSDKCKQFTNKDCRVKLLENH